MKRGEKNKPLWRKITPGVVYPFPNQRGRRIKPQEQVRATEEELGKKIKHFELIEDAKGKKATKAPKEAEEVEIPEGENYGIISVGKGWYDVVSSEGKVMNEKKLREDAAKELKESLEEETSE